MRRLTLALTLSALAVAPAALLAATIPYANVGTVPTFQTLTATSTTISLYYVKAGDTGAQDTINFNDLTSGFSSAYFFPNQNTTAPGATVSFKVNIGDVIAFNVKNFVFTLSSVPSLNTDGITHAYVMDFAGGPIILNGAFSFPTGLYIGMEDVILHSPGYDSDLNYNDNVFIATGLKATPPPAPSAVPEPATLSLLATGLLGAAGAARRRFSSR